MKPRNRSYKVNQSRTVVHSTGTIVNHTVLCICQNKSPHHKKEICAVADLTEFTVVILLQYIEY